MSALPSHHLGLGQKVINEVMSRLLSSVGFSTRNNLTIMIKSTLAAVAAAPLFAGAAVAGPYVNVETNAGWTGADYTGAVTETHVGFEGELGTDAGWYVQAGPAFVTEDGGETTTEMSGKVGIGVDVTERLNVYGEVAAITSGEIDFDNDLDYGVKVGAKFSF